MMHRINWKGRALAFIQGETVASALLRAGVLRFGTLPTGQAAGVFCGIGQCQGCLIRADNQIREACLLPCSDGMTLSPIDGDGDV